MEPTNEALTLTMLAGDAVGAFAHIPENEHRVLVSQGVMVAHVSRVRTNRDILRTFRRLHNKGLALEPGLFHNLSAHKCLHSLRSMLGDVIQHTSDGFGGCVMIRTLADGQGLAVIPYIIGLSAEQISPSLADEGFVALDHARSLELFGSCDSPHCLLHGD